MEKENQAHESMAETESTLNQKEISENHPEELNSHQNEPVVPLNDSFTASDSSQKAKVERVQLESFGPETKHGDGKLKIDLLMNLPINVSIELGRTQMLIKDILNLGIGSIVELDKVAGDTVDLFVNNQKFAEGEVVVIDENFGIRITSLLKSNDDSAKINDRLVQLNNN